jgi:hypothetical protein
LKSAFDEPRQIKGRGPRDFPSISIYVILHMRCQALPRFPEARDAF